MSVDRIPFSSVYETAGTRKKVQQHDNVVNIERMLIPSVPIQVKIVNYEHNPSNILNPYL